MNNPRRDPSVYFLGKNQMQLAPCCCLSLLSFLTVLLLTCRRMTMFSFHLCKEIKGHSKCYFFMSLHKKGF